MAAEEATDEVHVAAMGAALFEGVDPELVGVLLAEGKVREVAPREVVIEAGELYQEMFVVLEGELSVHLESVDDDPVAVISAGEAVGELGIIDGAPGSAYVVAGADTKLMTISVEDFWELVGASHAFARNMLQVLAGRLRNNNQAVSFESKRREESEQAAMIDRLTGVFNRAWLEDELPRACRIVRGEESDEGAANQGADPAVDEDGVPRVLSVSVIDIDHFKRFNDDHGHQAGDKVLEAVAQTLRRNLRDGDVVCRYGGEEFVVLFPGARLEPAGRAADRLRRAVERLRFPDLPAVHISLGVAELGPEDTPSTVIGRADAALYEAKTGGRNRVVLADAVAKAA